jgi:hypothetical protein
MTGEAEGHVRRKAIGFSPCYQMVAKIYEGELLGLVPQTQPSEMVSCP